MMLSAGGEEKEAADHPERDMRISPAIEASQMQPRRRARRKRVAAAIVACCLIAVATVCWGIQSTMDGHTASSASSQPSSQADSPSEGGDGSEVDASAASAGSTSSVAGSAAGTSQDQASNAAADSGGSSSASSAEGSAPSASSVDSGSVPSAAPSAPVQDPEPAAPASNITVSVSVSSSAVGDPVNGTATVALPRGATVYDALRATGFDITARSSQYGMYVSAIGGLSEKQHGGSSGWLYAVNGSTPAASCSSFELSDGDAVSWFYTV